MLRKYITRPFITVVVAALLFAALFLAPKLQTAHADAADTVDEIHYSFGDASAQGTLPDSVWFDWRGQEQNIYYGLDSSYGQTATSTNLITPETQPVDNAAEPFREVQLSGLTPSTTYHYRIGVTGLDHTFQTIPSGDFNWVDMGDTSSTYCDAWMAQTQALVAQQNPTFVTHGGDISYANVCGQPAVHRYFQDQEMAWSHGAAFQPAWGNHEFGQPGTENGETPPPGTPADTMNNYKDRVHLTNAQTVLEDGPNTTSKPGCGAEIGVTHNTCQGEDWGWFETGHVLYISYPEIWGNAQTEWEAQAFPLMQNAQNDPNIDYIVTYGHRPVYTNIQADTYSPQIRASVTQLAAQFSPNATHPNGKYILNVAHHAHVGEVFAPINGLVNIVNGGGGAGLAKFASPPTDPANPPSVYQIAHPEILSSTYNATQHSLTVRMLCGPAISGVTVSCIQGSQLYQQTFFPPNATPPAPVVTSAISDGVSSVQVGQQLAYTVTASNSVPGSTPAQGVTTVVTLPTNVSFVSATNGGVHSGNTVTWNFGVVNGGQNATGTLTVTVQSGNPGDYLTMPAHTTTTDNSCTTVGSSCTVTDVDSIGAATQQQYITNQGVETNLTGWTGKYNSSSAVAITRDTTVGHASSASIKVAGLTGASNLASGFSDTPRWVSSTTPNTTYTASLWVNPTFVGQNVTLRLRELKNGTSTIVTGEDKTFPLTALTPGWQTITGTITTSVASGNQLAYAVYSSSISAGQSFYADDFSLTTGNAAPPPDTTAPSTPGSLHATPSSQTTINLSWTASSDNVGVTGYNVFRSDIPGAPLATTTSTTYADNLLTANTAYTYSVVAFDAANNSSAAAVTTTSTLPVPSAPSDVAATASSTEVDLSWTAINGASSYIVQRDGPDGTQVFPTISPSYADATVVPNTTYTYTVSATDLGGDLATNAPLQVTTLPASLPIPPTAPGSLVATASNSPLQVNLTWAPSTGPAAITSYTITRMNGATQQTFTATNPMYSDVSVAANTAYTYAVAATDSNNNISVPSNVATVTTPQPAPKQWVTNPSLETDLTGWSGIYNATSKNSRVAGGFDGGFSLRSVNNTSALGATGFVDKPHWLDGTAGKATVAGMAYSASLYVKADVANEKFSLYLRELSPAGATVSSKTIMLTAANTSWTPLTTGSTPYIAVNSGDSLGFYVSVSNAPAQQGFNADLLSLTSPN